MPETHLCVLQAGHFSMIIASSRRFKWVTSRPPSAWFCLRHTTPRTPAAIIGARKHNNELEKQRIWRVGRKSVPFSIRCCLGHIRCFDVEAPRAKRWVMGDKGTSGVTLNELQPRASPNLPTASDERVSQVRSQVSAFFPPICSSMISISS